MLITSSVVVFQKSKESTSAEVAEYEKFITKLFSNVANQGRLQPLQNGGTLRGTPNNYNVLLSPLPSQHRARGTSPQP